MRAIWSGSISFGLVNIPVKLYVASEPKGGLEFDMLHKKDFSPIRYARICRADGKEIPFEDIVKGYEYSNGDYVVLTDEDFKKANLKKTKSIEISDFANEDEIDTIYFEKPYYLEPQKGAEKAYALLREALKRSKRVGVARYVIRNREHIGILKTHGNLVLLNQLRYFQEVRNTKELNIPAKEILKKGEIDLAIKLIDELTKPFEPKEYKDTYTEELKKIINKKAKGQLVTPQGEEPVPTKVPDIVSVLRKSLEQQRHRT